MSFEREEVYSSGYGACLESKTLVSPSHVLVIGLLTSCTVTGESNFLRIKAVGFSVYVKPLDGCIGLFDGYRVLCLWRWCVVDKENACA